MSDRRLRVFIDAIAGDARLFTISRAVATVGHVKRARHGLEQLGNRILEVRMRPEVANVLELEPHPTDPGLRLMPDGGGEVTISATAGDCENIERTCLPADVLAGSSCRSCCAELLHSLRGRLLERLPLARCKLDCPGWVIVDVDERGQGGEIQACDACNRAQSILRRVGDLEVARLPEAQAHLQARRRKRARRAAELDVAGEQVRITLGGQT